MNHFAIFRDPMASVAYAASGGSLSAYALKRIKINPAASVEYARTVVKAPIPELESMISKDPVSAALYAVNVLKAPWPSAENAIKRHPQAAAIYSSIAVF